MATKGMWTKNLTDADTGFIMKASWGFSKFSITNNSAVGLNIAIVGSKQVETMPSEPYLLVPDESFNYSEDETVQDFTITLVAGATAKIVGFN